MLLLSVIISIAILWSLAYRGVDIRLWFAVLLLCTAANGFVADLSWYAQIPLWLATAGAALLVGHGSTRKKLLSTHLLEKFRQVIPPMSQTEKEALDAGNVWWDAELFSGRPDWRKLLDTPPAVLPAEEQAFLDGPVNTLCQMLDDWQITQHDKDLPPQVWRYIKDQKFFGLILPREYGGLGFSAYGHSQVITKLASRSIVAAVTVMVPNSLGPGKLLLHYGTERQKAHYLPRLAAGVEIPCFALTGPDAGSDAGAMPDTGIVSYGDWRGERTLGIRLNWEKRYITLGPVATLIGLAFKLRDPNHLAGTEDEPGITVALIPRNTPGVTIGQRHVTLDIPFQNGPNRGKDVFIPMSQVIGGKNQLGKGWRMLMESLAEGRGISLPALSVSAGKNASRYTGAYAAVRKQFGLPIGQFEGVEESLARIAGLTYQMDAARKLTLSALDIGQKPSVISAIIKYQLTEKYRQVINDAMDIQAGSGICMGPSNLMGRVYQALPIAVTVEGANILTRSMIIFGQGAMRCHPWILKEFQAAQIEDTKKALFSFDQAILGHLGFLLGNLARSLFLGLTRGRFSYTPPDCTNSRFFQQLNWMSAAFALSADVVMMTLGGTLKRKERLSARLGDLLSELFLTSAVLKQHADDSSPEEDLPLLHWACETSFYRMQESLRSLFRNMPLRSLGRVLNLVIFPTGYPYSEPRDSRSRQAAQILLASSDSRDRLTEGIFITRDPGYRQGIYEQAFLQAEKVNPIEIILRRAKRDGALVSKSFMDQAREALQKGMISMDDLGDLKKMNELRQQVINVDSFSDYGRQNLLREMNEKSCREHAA